MERLQKIIASSGICSRRKAEELISSGKVFVNGKKIIELGTKVSEKDEIVVDGKKIETENKEYYLLNKPRGVVSTVKDELGRKNIVDLINTKMRIFPVGRLDYDTTGLILLTNDGELANILMHPKYEIEKTYIAKIEGVLSMEKYHELKNGIVIDKIKTIPKRVKIKSKNIEKNTSIIEITLVEGRNHIVKNLFKTLGYEVLKLTRTKYANFEIGSLKSGEYRRLSLKEVRLLYNLGKEQSIRSNKK